MSSEEVHLFLGLYAFAKFEKINVFRKGLLRI